MKTLTVEWIEKAEGDRDTALRELELANGQITMQPVSTPNK